MEEILEITLYVADTLKRLNVPYLIGGSLASSFHGIPRATQDVDIVAALQPEHIDLLVASLEPTFYVDKSMIQEALRRRASFNVIHLETMFKVDIFLPQLDDVSRQEMERRQTYTITDSPPLELVIASPEDTILHKLYWYRLGGGVSDRQWRDVLGVLKVQHTRLDKRYLDRIAILRDVEDLLQRAWEEAGLDRDDADAP